MNFVRNAFAPGLLFALAGCAGGMHMQHHDMTAMAPGQGGAMDMQSMCAMHKKMMAGMTAAEQQAMMDEHMKSMTPEMRQHMQQMIQQCK